MITAGHDPASSGWQGLAFVDDDGPKAMLAISGSNQRTAWARIASEMRWHQPTMVGCEHPPTTMPKASGRQGSQGLIGCRIGEARGRMMQLCQTIEPPITFTDAHVSKQRATKTRAADKGWRARTVERTGLTRAQAVRAASKAGGDTRPVRSRLATAEDCEGMQGIEAGRGVYVSVYSCGHESDPWRYAKPAPSYCGQCRAHQPADRAEEWALWAVAVVRRIAPELLDRLVAERLESNSRLRDGRAEWRIPGVNDACVALLIAIDTHERRPACIPGENR
jgi:hypothetical protein